MFLYNRNMINNHEKTKNSKRDLILLLFQNKSKQEKKLKLLRIISTQTIICSNLQKNFKLVWEKTINNRFNLKTQMIQS